MFKKRRKVFIAGMEKDWECVRNYETQYQVHPSGLIRGSSKLERIQRKYDTMYREVRPGKIMSASTDLSGRLFIDLKDRIHGGVHTVHIDRVVAYTFVPNPMNLPYVRHKDGNLLNNAASNLEWCSEPEVQSIFE